MNTEKLSNENETEALNKHVVSGKQADLFFLKNFCEEQYEEAKTTAWGEQYEKGLQKAYAKVLNQIEFRLACASSAVDKTVSDGVNGGQQRDLDIYQNLIEP
jgi:hypothetical protein